MCALLEAMGMTTRWREDGALEIVRGAEVTPEAPYELVERMRASSAVLGPLLASMGRASVAMPGGDDFGARPIDMHLQGLEALGATFTLSHGVIEGRAAELVGTEVVLEYPSVGATENLLMAGVLAKGRTTVHNAAREPEIADLAAFLNRMGGRILGAGSPVITIDGVDELRAVEHVVIPDRIEVATFLRGARRRRRRDHAAPRASRPRRPAGREAGPDRAAHLTRRRRAVGHGRRVGPGRSTSRRCRTPAWPPTTCRLLVALLCLRRRHQLRDRERVLRALPLRRRARPDGRAASGSTATTWSSTASSACRARR